MASAQCHRVIAIMSAGAQDTRLNTSVIGGISWPFGAIATIWMKSRRPLTSSQFFSWKC